MNEEEVFAELGEEGIGRMVQAFYKRVKVDDLIGPMYPEGQWEQSEWRLREFLNFRLGGVKRYIEERGHPRLKARHIPFSIGFAERDRWIKLMGEAMEEAEVSESAQALLKPLFAFIADNMRNRDESGASEASGGLNFLK
ncbi:MAG: globin [Verrucomicrobia bacterium]|nr:globin [Verrucomicrobiota bacterium]